MISDVVESTKLMSHRSEWRLMRVDEIGDVQLGRQRSPKNRSAKFPTKYLRAANITERGLDLTDVLEMDFKPDERERYLLRPGDIVLSEASGSVSQVGKPAIWKGELPDCCFQNTVIRLRPKHADPKYLLWVFTHFYRNGLFAKVAAGVGINHLSATKFKQLEIPVPPLPEQGRIVAEMEKQFTRLDAGVAALRRTQANLKCYRAAVLKAACEGRLVPTEIKTWEEGRLGNVLAGVEAGKSFKCEERPPTKSEIGVVRVSAVTWGSYNEFESKTCQDADRVEERYFVKSGDFLFSRANTIQLIGACVIARHVTLRVMLSDKILRFHFSAAVIPRWILYWLQSDFGRHEIERLSTGNQESMRNIGQERIRQIVVKFPSVTEQKRIVAEVERRLSVMEELGTVVDANLKRATRLRQSILQQAFSGKLVEARPTEVAQLTAKAQPARRPNRHFARAVLSAEIVHQLHAEPTFGRIKHQKIFHLCEHIAQLTEIEGQYHREAAGPLDNKLIYANESELKRQKWYAEAKRDSFGHVYHPLENAGFHQKYLERFWPDQLPTIHRLIDLMRKWDTDTCEIFCTAYAAWNDLLLWGKEVTDEAVMDQVLNHWHIAKRRFPRERWSKAIIWMKTTGFVPNGFGRATSGRGGMQIRP